jgi:hypothetical protein
LAPSPGATAPTPLVVNVVTLQAYAACFKIMAIIVLLITPGIFLFRGGGRRGPAKKIASLC